MNYKEYIKIKKDTITIFDYKGVLTKLPASIFEGLSSIHHLFIIAKNLTEFPDTLNKLVVHKSIRLVNNKIKELPEFILNNAANLQNLELDVYKINLSGVLKKFTQLQSLRLETIKGKQLPADICELPHLKQLHLQKKIGKKINHLDLIPLIEQSQSIKKLLLDFPLDLSQIGSQITSFNKLSELKTEHLPKNIDFLSLALLRKVSVKLSWQNFSINKHFKSLVNKHPFSDHQRKILFAIYLNRLDLMHELVDQPLNGLLNTQKTITIYLSNKLSPTLAKRAKEFLSTVSFKIKKEASLEGLSSEDVVLLNSKTPFEFVIQVFLKTQNIATEDHLKTLLNELESPWLQQTENEASLQHIQQLILSNQTENTLLALEIIESGGVDQQIETMLAVLMMAHPDKQITKKAEKLFKKFGSSSTYNYIKRSRIYLRRSGNTLRKLDQLFDQKTDLDELTFRILHAVIVGDNYNVLDVEKGVLFIRGKFDTSLPSFIRTCLQISSINFQKSSGIHINLSFKLLHHLKSLDLAGCNYEIGKELGQLSQLKQLNLSSNQLLDAACLKTLTQLRHLNLEGCLINNWEFLQHLPNLEYLNIGRSKLKEIPKEVLEHKGIRELILKQNKIKEIPKDIAQYSFKVIDLSNNLIESIDYSIFAIEGLQQLLLRSNKIKIFDATKIKKNSTLELLNLANNSILDFKLLPLIFPKLINLDVSKNNLTYLDDSIFKETNLSNLFASHNQITALPKAISKQSFTYLFLQNNLISELPAFVEGMQIQNLNLSNNKISYIHPSIVDKQGDYSKLYWKLKGNPIAYIPYE